MNFPVKRGINKIYRRMLLSLLGVGCVFRNVDARIHIYSSWRLTNSCKMIDWELEVPLEMLLGIWSNQLS